MISMSRVFLVVHGIVQDVGYRAFVTMHAQKHSIKGFVRNMSDGSVEILAEAEENKLSEFIKDIKVDKGHRHQVFSVETKNGRLKEFENKSYTDFEFLHGKFPSSV
jgi:acylphosphatase